MEGEKEEEEEECLEEGRMKGEYNEQQQQQQQQQQKVMNSVVRRRRSRLPKPQSNVSNVKSMISMLWNNIGKDMTLLSFPVTFNEPINILQRMCEEFEYSELLDRACGLRDPAERVLNVALFAISGYSSTLHRCEHKPYNPLLGETYECDRTLDCGFRFIAEKVVHYPPVCVCYVEGVAGYTYTEWLSVNTKFGATSMDLVPEGKTVLYLKRPSEERYTRGGKDGSENGAKENDTCEQEDSYHGKRYEGKGNKEKEEKTNELETETERERQEGKVIEEDEYEWNKVTTSIYNIFVPGSKIYMEHHGNMIIKDNTTGYQCRVIFHKSSFFSSRRHRVTGTVYDASGREVRSISGCLTDGIYLGKVPLWRPNPMPDAYESYYGLT
ncbi:hypothetical protein Pmani_018565 [Petrolisthes manimaculis]|uniref:Oxysterol-binding protein n=1 Tax=Petrolisthes manimaculis TaxID=1843537 RepID=A0AAE1PJX8_9EUCA|nr:hypothetical protein Pmani_018565 [Petrolisthes manimaculis]